MACGGCARRRAARNAPAGTKESLMGGYKYLTDRQLRARLEVYKKNNCKDCEKRYECDYSMFVQCKEVK
jgi:hypothetical protein